MGNGRVLQNQRGKISGEWSASSEEDRVLTVGFGDTFLRKITVPTGDGAQRFRFTVAEPLLALIPPGSVLVVSDSEGNPLPCGDEPETVGSATDGGEKLLKLIGMGYVVDKWGTLKLPFSASQKNRERCRNAMDLVCSYFRTIGISIFPHYGTLLGLARGGKFLDHDDDVDMSVMIYAGTLDGVVESYLDIIARVQRDGHSVGQPAFGQFHMKLKDYDLPSVDVFLSWALEPTQFNTYFGVAGQISGELKFEASTIEGVPILAPVQMDEILALTYGPSWRVPDPTFLWQPSTQVSKVMRELAEAGKRGVERRAA